MPKETIASYPGGNFVELRWGSGPEIQIVTMGRDQRQRQEIITNPEDRAATLGPVMFGVYSAGDSSFGGWVEDSERTWILFLDRKFRPVVMWTQRDKEGGVVEGSCIDVERVNDGWFADLDRRSVNRLVKALRRARDTAFGKDE